MTIDGRKKAQRFKNLYGLNEIYVWKNRKTYQVGINGTSHHHTNLTKHEAESMINILIFAKN